MFLCRNTEEPPSRLGPARGFFYIIPKNLKKKAYPQPPRQKNPDCQRFVCSSLCILPLTAGKNIYLTDCANRKNACLPVSVRLNTPACSNT